MNIWSNCEKSCRCCKLQVVCQLEEMHISHGQTLIPRICGGAKGIQVDEEKVR